MSEELATKEQKIEQVKKILADHGIKMSVSACGCCDSPWVSFEYDGLVIADSEHDFNFEMFSDEEHDQLRQGGTVDDVAEFMKAFYKDTPICELENYVGLWESLEDRSLKFTTKENEVLMYPRELAVEALKRVVKERVERQPK